MIKKKDKKQRETWLDLFRVTAILFVLIDHIYDGRIFDNHSLVRISNCSVSLFVLATGVTSYWQFRRKSSYNKIVLKKLFRIVIPYFIAALIHYLILADEKSVVSFFIHLIRFDIVEPFYYVALYIQLVLVSPVIYCLMNLECRRLSHNNVEALLLAGLLVVSIITTNHAFFPWIILSGGKLFGGTFIVVLYLGMLLGEHFDKIDRTLLVNKGYEKCALIVICLLIPWALFLCVDDLHFDSFLPFGEGFNPPGFH